VSACSSQSLWLPSKPAYLVLFLTGANSEKEATPSRALPNNWSTDRYEQDFYEKGYVENPLEKGALRVLLMRSKTRTVRQFGIQLWRVNGEPIVFQHPELYKIIGLKVECFWDPRLIGELHIYRRDGERLKLVCTAQHAPLMKLGATSDDLHRAVYEPRKAARAYHQEVKAFAEHTYKSLLERIADVVRERHEPPQDELPVAVNQKWVPRITQSSFMAREQDEFRRTNPVSMEVDPERALEELARQRQEQELSEVDRQYAKAQRMLRLLE